MQEFIIKDKKLLEYKGTSENVVIPDGVEIIYSLAFQNNKSIQSVILPDSVVYIQNGAFASCTALNHIRLSENLRILEPYVFSGCHSLVSVTIPEKVSELNRNVFNGCNALLEIRLSSRETKIIGEEDTSVSPMIASVHYPEEPKTKWAVIFMGIQGSGKTTYYHRVFSGKFRHINLDILHTRNKERQALQSCMDEGADFVVDNTNPTKEDRARYIEPAKVAGYHVIGYFFQSKLQDCIRRNNLRTGKEKVPATAIAATSNILEMPSKEEGFDELYFIEPWGDTEIRRPWRT